MTRLNILRHEFVEFIPKVLPDGVIYISIPYATVIHNCCCGCGVRVVTPLSPVEWTLSFDGRSVSLSPSIGNWSFPCRSHYWVRNNRVIWSDEWSDEEIDAVKKDDDHASTAFYKPKSTAKTEAPTPKPKKANKKSKPGLKSKIKRWLSNTRHFALHGALKQNR